MEPRNQGWPRVVAMDLLESMAANILPFRVTIAINPRVETEVILIATMMVEEEESRERMITMEKMEVLALVPIPVLEGKDAKMIKVFTLSLIFFSFLFLIVRSASNPLSL